MADGPSAHPEIAHPEITHPETTIPAIARQDGAPPLATRRGNARGLPSVQSLLEHHSVPLRLAGISRTALTEAVRAELARLRADLLAGTVAAVPDHAAILAAAERACGPRPTLRRVINATGIVVHTNLGRAPLAAEAIAAAAEAGSGACNLEFDLETGRRGARGAGVEALLCRLTGAEAALAVNNNAAAMLLALTALAGGNRAEAPGEVIVSRGELVEIGGGFRIPDIIAQGGARLVEVGTTNKTRLADYQAAITPQTRILLKVHQSNFRIVGFTTEAGLSELAGLARAYSLLLLDDLGSGTLAPLPGGLAPLEPTVRESLAAGSDLVAFSGDKLLGGPQAGLLAGGAAIVDRLRRHPLLRALRLDKMRLAALEATLQLHADPDRARTRIPVLRILAQPMATLQARAEALCMLLVEAGLVEAGLVEAGLVEAGPQEAGPQKAEPQEAGRLAPRGCKAEIVASVGHAGGGALPGQDIASRAVAVSVRGRSPDALARALRAQTPAVVGRIHDGRLLLDVLTLQDSELREVAEAIRQVGA